MEGGECLQSPAEDPLLESVCPQGLASCWTPCRNPDRGPFGKGPLAPTLTLASFITDISQVVGGCDTGQRRAGAISMEDAIAGLEPSVASSFGIKASLNQVEGLTLVI